MMGHAVRRTNQVGSVPPIPCCEVPLISQTPNDIPSSSTVVVVDLDYPTLVPHGDEYVSIVFGVDDCICMCPVWEELTGCRLTSRWLNSFHTQTGFRFVSRSTITSP